MTDQTPRTEATTELESLRITNGSDPRETPRTEAGRPPLDPLTKAHDDGWMEGVAWQKAQARAEALDVDVLAEVTHQECIDDWAKRPPGSTYTGHGVDSHIEAATRRAARYRAILAGETE